jgi:predicted DNA-binding transcriptional regulator YafY
MRSLISRAMQQSDDLVLVFDYVDAKGVATRRVVSPIRFAGSDRFLGLCLSREEPRQFYLARCKNLRIDLSTNYLMPVEMLPVERSLSTISLSVSGADASQVGTLAMV